MISQKLFEEVYLSGDCNTITITNKVADIENSPLLNGMSLEEVMYGYGAAGGVNMKTLLSELSKVFEQPTPPDYVFDSINMLDTSTTKGKKGDRVYNAPKAFWNKSK